ncbi:MAG: trypsin-like peptidase domain-containing protein [Thermoguttaceae bacterium]|jgi:S1-C subfamily serine protease|nr:trypsin-like peptidase domain-containing protein [Thermoguttaceae bacterium]
MKKRTVFLCVASAALGAALSALISGPFGGETRPGTSQALAAVGPQDAVPNLGDLDELTPEERVNIAVYENVNRSVVNITTRGYRGDRFLFVEIPSEGEGSGSVIDQQGHLVTNSHVVEGAQEIQVTLFNSKTYEARLVGIDPGTDIAVLRINAPADELYPVRFGDSSRLRVGQRVFALGNPFGLERTLSTGIISSLDRWLPSRRKARTIKQIIQIDAAINPGNSGGPLLDSRGRMIGMNTAIASKTGTSAGVGFAIPINTIARVVPQLIRTGRVIRPETGIARVYETEHGLLIDTLTPGGPAERAGLQGPRVVRRQKRQGPIVYEYRQIDRNAADLIVGVDGKPIRTADEFLDLVESKQPGDTVTLSIVRAGRQIEVPLRLEAGE